MLGGAAWGALQGDGAGAFCLIDGRVFCLGRPSGGAFGGAGVQALLSGVYAGVCVCVCVFFCCFNESSQRSAYFQVWWERQSFNYIPLEYHKLINDNCGGGATMVIVQAEDGEKPDAQMAPELGTRGIVRYESGCEFGPSPTNIKEYCCHLPLLLLVGRLPVHKEHAPL